jgi:mono/diheme cytochrome c family protein
MSVVPAWTAPAPATTQRAVIDQYCVGCHNAKLRTAHLELDKLDLSHLGDHAEIGEKVVRKLRAGMMPPTGLPQPDPAKREALITWMESELDHSAVPHLPAPGVHRLNRTELYERDS